MLGKDFVFLSFSPSQLRTCGCWMVNTAGTAVRPAMMRSWMGTFKDVSPAKHAARQGQCFSTTADVGLLKEHEVQCVPDIANGEEVFTGTWGGGGMRNRLEKALVISKMLGSGPY